MEQIRKFLRDKGFALALLACLVAAAAAGVWAVRTVRDERDKNLSGLKTPDSTSTAPGIDEGLDVYKRQDLKGRTILSTGKGTTPEYVLRYLLTKNGLDPDKDVKIEYYSEASEAVSYTHLDVYKRQA